MKPTLKNWTLIFITLLLSNLSHAQEIKDYEFYEQSCTEYIHLDEDDRLPLSGGTFSITNYNFYGFYNDIPIGFKFKYLGKEVTEISASLEGWVLLGEDIIYRNGYYYNTYNYQLNNGNLNPTIAPFWGEYMNFIRESRFSFTTIGNAPNRIFVAQWDSVAFSSGNACAELESNLAFQLRLYEGSNKIEFAYDNFENYNDDNYYNIGLSDLVDDDGDRYFIALKTDKNGEPIFENPEIVHNFTNINQSTPFNRKYLPPSGTTYTFTPKNPNITSLKDFTLSYRKEEFRRIKPLVVQRDVEQHEVLGDSDEGVFNDIPIGFQVSFDNKNYQTISASTNGWLSLGQELSSPSPGNFLEDGKSRPIIAPLWDDLDLSEGVFQTYTLGRASERKFVAEWKNVKWPKTAEEPNISFQVWIYEEDGRIEFRYKTDNLDFNPILLKEASASIGIAGTNTGKNNFISIYPRIDYWSFTYFESSTEEEFRGFNYYFTNGQSFNFITPITYLVTNTNDSGAGSLRDAIDNANIYTSYDLGTRRFIKFNINTPPPWEITLESELPIIYNKTVIDATTQPGSNSGQLVTINGQNISLQDEDDIGAAFHIQADSCEIHGFEIINFPSYGIRSGFLSEGVKIGGEGKGNIINNCPIAIELQETFNSTIEGNRVGVNDSGNEIIGNQAGIIVKSSSKVTIKNNLVSGNTTYAIQLNSTINSTIQENLVGINLEGNAALPNQIGISLNNGSVGNTIYRNVVSGNEEDGIYLDVFTSENKITGNFIGISSQLEPVPNGGNGIYVKSNDNFIGGYSIFEANFIGANVGDGIQIDGGVRNAIHHNFTLCNDGKGISLVNGGNNLKEAPTISYTLASGVFGTGNAGDSVEVFLVQQECDDNEGALYLGTEWVNFEGKWNLKENLEKGAVVVAVATDEEGNTSEFSKADTVVSIPNIFFVRPLSVNVGDTLTIEGENLSKVTSIKFYPNILLTTVPETLFISKTDNRIRLKVPNLAQTGTITATNIAGSTASGQTVCILPPKPTNLQISSVGSREIKLTWDPNGNKSVGFNIERSENNEEGFKVIDDVSAEVTQYTDRDVQPNITYYYRVQADNDCTFDVKQYSNQVGASISDIITEIEGTEWAKQVKLFPNPNNGAFTLQFPENKTIAGFEALLYDVQGRVVWKDVFQEQIHSKQIAVPTLNDGLYYLRMSDGKETLNLNILIAK
ncbi:MAG: hypothetical protein OHK0038_00700 [Flammeovirgaceae bacterium]